MQVTWPAYQVYLYLSFAIAVMGTWANQPMSNMSASSEAWRWSALLGSSGSFQLHFSWLAPSGALYGMMHHEHKHPLIFFNCHSVECRRATRVSQDNSRNKRIIQQVSLIWRSIPTPQDVLVIVVLIVLNLIVAVSSIVIMHKVMIHCTWFHHSKNCDLQISCLILRVIPILPFCSANSLLKIESVQNMVDTHTTDSHLV